jgi:ribosome-dependent ATPase
MSFGAAIRPEGRIRPNVANRAHPKAFAGVSPTCRKASAAIYPTLSVFENIDFFGRLFGQSASSAAPDNRAFDRHRADPFEDRPAGKFSGGMKKTQPVPCAD